MNFLNSVRELLIRTFRGAGLASLKRLKTFGLRVARLVQLIVRDAAEGQLTLWAMSLAYTTFLSLVPLLALAFSVLKAFGVHNQIRPTLENFLAPLGPKGPEIVDKMIGFVENVQVGVLGSIGLGLLFYTVLSMFQKVDSAFNYIWRIHRPRSWTKKFSDYLSVLLVGPVLVFSALGITASVTNAALYQKFVAVEPIGRMVYWTGQVVPYLLVCAAFMLAYLLIPNTRVRFSSALMGGLLAGSAWQATGWFFSNFIASSSQYTAIYSGFAVVLLFLFWVYLSWLILLVGGQVAFFHQHPLLLSRGPAPERAEDGATDQLAFSLMFLIGHHFYHKKKPWTVEDLVAHFGLSAGAVQRVLEALEKKELILKTRDEPPAYVPARDIGMIRLNELLDAVRVRGGKPHAGAEVLSHPNVERVLSRIDQAVSKSLGAGTVRDLVLAPPEPLMGDRDDFRKPSAKKTAKRHGPSRRV